MKIRYDKDDDVMMIWLSKKAKVDYAEQTRDVIMHFTKNNKPVLMEILNATAFLKNTASKLPHQIRKQIPLVA